LQDLEARRSATDAVERGALVERTSATKALGGELLPPGAEPLQADDPAAIDGHRLTARLASGGTSVIYLGRDPDGGRVVVKTTRAPDQTQARRWLRTEAASTRRLPAFCTARLLTDGTAHSPPYLVSEYVAGPSLTQFVEDLGPLEPEQLHALAIALARALAAVHAAGLIHCDLKPGNILLAADGPRVIDFSIAQEAPISGRPADIGTVPYSPGWVAPERLSGYPAGPASDVFGWGCLIGYAATGRSPFDGETTGEPGRRSVAGPGELAALDEPLRGLVEAALAVDPADRPTTGEITTRLGGADGPAREPEPRPAAPPRPRETAVPARSGMSSVDAPTAPMSIIELEPDPDSPTTGSPTTGPPALPRPAQVGERRADHSGVPAVVASEVASPLGAEPGADPQWSRVDHAAGGRPAEPSHEAGEPPRRVEYAADTALLASRFRTEEDLEQGRRPRRLRMAAMIGAPAALVAVLATVIAMASTGAHQGEPAGNGGAVTPGRPPADPQVPVVPHRRSHGPRPTARSSAPEGAAAPSPGHTSQHGATVPGRPGRPGHSHKPPPPPPSTPTPTPTNTPTPTPTPTGTVPAQGSGGAPTSSG
jgi:serine/threonine protein kinase